MKDVATFRTSLLHRKIKESYHVEALLLDHYTDLIAKRKAAFVPQEKPVPVPSIVPESQAVLKAELFAEFKKANLGVYDCFRMASHNALLIKSSFAKLSEAAAKEVAEPVAIKEIKASLKYWHEYLDKTAEFEVQNNVIIMKGYENDKAIGTENEKILIEPLVFPYLNLSTFSQKRTLCAIGSKKNSFDPDIERTDASYKSCTKRK